MWPGDGLTRTALAHNVMVAGEIGTVADVAYHAVADNAPRDNPLRVEVHTGNIANEQRGLGRHGSQSYTHLHGGLAVDSGQHKCRHIDHHIFGASLGMSVSAPSAALHVGHYPRVGWRLRRSGLQHLRKPPIQRVDGLDIVQEDGYAVGLDLGESALVERTVGGVHPNIKKGAIAEAYTRRVNEVNAVEKHAGVDITEALARHIAQI